MTLSPFDRERWEVGRCGTPQGKRERQEAWEGARAVGKLFSLLRRPTPELETQSVSEKETTTGRQA